MGTFVTAETTLALNFDETLCRISRCRELTKLVCVASDVLSSSIDSNWYFWNSSENVHAYAQLACYY
jgi:hypothetical protein